MAFRGGPSDPRMLGRAKGIPAGFTLLLPSGFPPNPPGSQTVQESLVQPAQVSSLLAALAAQGRAEEVGKGLCKGKSERCSADKN